MPTLETIRRLKVEATTSGVAQTAAELNKLSTAQEGVAKSSQTMATVTDQTSRKQLPVEVAYKRQTLALDEAARKQDQYAKAARVADQALAQGVITQQQHAERLTALGTKYEQASVASKAFAQATSGVTGQLIAMSAGAGPVGVFLSALGPWGVAAAVGLGMVASAINAARESAAIAGQKARDLVELSEATKLSINELRGLKQAAAQFGVGEDQIETWLTKAAISMETARTGSGELADALTAVDPAFLKALQNAGTMAERLDVLSQAAKAAKEQGKEVALYWRDVFGRGSGRADLVMEATQAAGGIAAVGNTMKQYGGAAAEEIRHRAELSEQNKKLTKEYDALKASMLQATTVLQAENLALQLGIDLMKKRTEETKKRTDAEAELSRQLQAGVDQRVQGTDAEQIVSRARQRNKIPGAGSSQETLQLGTQQDAAILAMLADGAEKAAAKIDMLAEAQKRLSEDTKWISALGDAATSAEKAQLAIDKLNVAFESNAFGAKESAEAQALFNRALASVAVQANALTAVHDAAIQTLHARTAAEREAAAAASVRASDSSGDAELRAQQAVTMEIEKQKAAHNDAMAAMRGQLAVAQAVTGAQKIAAQEQATFNDLIRQGRTEEQALAEAAMQTAIAHANANTAVEQSIHGLEQELEVLKACCQVDKDRILARQAYDNAIASGADEESARRLQAATEAVSSEKRRQAVENEKLKKQDEERYRLCIAMAAAERAYLAEIEKIYSGQAQLIDQMDFNVGAPGAPGSSTTERISGIRVGSVQGGGGTMIDIAGRYVRPDDKERQAQVDQERAAGIKTLVDQFEMNRIEAQISGNKPGEISAVQQELAFYRGQPRTLENLNQIKSLQDALTELTKATEDNTAQTATLSDIYGAGHAGRIGYYAEGQTTKTIGQPTISSNPPVWGNPITTPAPANSNVPRWSLDQYLGIQHFAEGGTVTRPTLALVGEAGPEDITPVGKRTGQPTVVQNFNIMMPARSDLGDRSTQRQMFEGIGRRASVAR